MWSQPRLLHRADCSAVAATIDSGSRYHIAASCARSIRYFVSRADGSWSSTVFAHPAGREERDPQVAFEGNVIYVAFSRVALKPPDEGCGGGEVISDVGVYYRRRTLPDGRWSSARRIGLVDDRLQSLRVAGGTLHATVQGADGRVYYETLTDNALHRYRLPGATEQTSLRVGSDGRARVAYEAGRALRYGVFAGSAFSTSPIPSITREFAWPGAPVLVLGRGNQAHLLWTVAYTGGGCAEPDPDPMAGTYYGTNATGAWESRRISTSTDVKSLTLDVDTGPVHALVGPTYFTNAPSGDWTSRKLTSGSMFSSVIRLDPATGTLLVVYIAERGVYVLTRS